MTGVEIAAIITALLAGLGALVKSFVDSRNASKKADLDTLKDSIDTQHKSDLCVITMLRDQVGFQGGQIKALAAENNQLHSADNAMRAENNQLSIELEAVRQENRELRLMVDGQAKKIEEQSLQITELQNENAVLRAKNTQLEQLTVELGAKLDGYRSGAKKPTGGLPPL